jgi:endonuclease III
MARRFGDFWISRGIDNVHFLFQHHCMQTVLRFGQEEDLWNIRNRLYAEFGSVRVEPRPHPLNQFVLCFISSRTRDPISLSASQNLLNEHLKFFELADVPVSRIHETIKNVTFSEKKAPELKQALQKIREGWNEFAPTFSSGTSVASALAQLEGIHGVGRKLRPPLLTSAMCADARLLLIGLSCAF